MVELKTLKDFDVGRDNQVSQAELIELHYELKQEAIKHIEHERKKFSRFNQKGMDYDTYATDVKIKWIKKFFNIVEPGDSK